MERWMAAQQSAPLSLDVCMQPNVETTQARHEGWIKGPWGESLDCLFYVTSPWSPRMVSTRSLGRSDLQSPEPSVGMGQMG